MNKYKKLQEEINIDLSKMKLYSFRDLENWGSDNFFKTNKDCDYYLIISDLHEGGYYQLKKSDTNNSSEIISKFQDDYDPSCNNDPNDFDVTNEVHENKNDYFNFLVNKIKSDKFPELFLKKINDFIEENGGEDMYKFLGYLDEELEWINYESCEFLIESLGLNRDLDLELIFEHMLEVNGPLEITQNPNIISFGGYYQCGEHEFFLGVCKE